MARYINADNLVDAKILGIQTRYADGWNDAIDAIRECEPTDDVRENVHGEWIDDTETDDDGEIVYRGIHCSKCQYSIPYAGLKSGTNFCPNCGADMRKGETNGFD